MMKSISILGSTGSIGTNTLEVVRSHPDQFQVMALACGKNLKLAKTQIEEFRPKLVSVAEESDAKTLRSMFSESCPEIVWGKEGAVQVATHPDSDLVLSAIVGAAGLVPTLEAIRAKKHVALANKEALVIAGHLMTQAAKKAGVALLPVDSEHNAIFQALQGHQREDVRRIILTASGGPFRNLSREDLKGVSVEEALKHPNWKMGPKITIDSATLMNKGLEMIEALWLFDLKPDQIQVHIHPQSVIHSMVEYHDGSVIAQLGIPDMRIPIAYALGYPERLSNTLPPMDLTRIRTLEFFEPDEDRFECLKLARQAMEAGCDVPCVLNAANEMAVQAFLNRKIKFLEISAVIQSVLEVHTLSPVESLEGLLEVDSWAREKATQTIERFL